MCKGVGRRAHCPIALPSTERRAASYRSSATATRPVSAVPGLTAEAAWPCRRAG